MKALFRYAFGAIPSSLFLGFLSSSVSLEGSTADLITYVTGNVPDAIYRVNLVTGQASPLVTTIPGPKGIALLNSTTAYVAANNQNIYRVNLTTGQYSIVTHVPASGGLQQLALQNSNTAYVISDTPSHTVYRVNLQTGESTPAVIIPANVQLVGLALVPNSTEAYVSSAGFHYMYRVDLATGASSLITTAPTDIQGISLPNNTTAYAASFFGDSVYSIDLTTGQISTLAALGTNAADVELANTTTPYALGANNIYLINPATGASSIAAANVGPNLQFIGFQLQLPTDGLHGNNLAFVNYLNKNAPFDALFSLTLQDDFLASLESAVPTRNAFSVVTADNNLFFLNQGLSSHLRHRRQLRYRTAAFEREETAFEEDWEDESLAVGDEEQSFFPATYLDENWEDELLATADEEHWLNAAIADEQEEDLPEAVEEKSPRQAERPYTLWAEGLGAWASQKAQNQTVGFDPTTGGLILGFEKTFQNNSEVGVGVSYLFTHIHEQKDAGFSNINQECLFVYGSWSYRRFYLDAALWGGLFQTDQERKIHLTGITFKSTSHPSGGQLDPHLEIGYTLTNKRYAQSHWQLMLDPFVMGDWVNTWQGSYKEKGNGPFNAGQKSHYSSFLRIEMGLRFYEGVRFRSWVLGFEQKGSYVYKNPFSVGTVKAFLVGSPGSFTVETLTSAHSLGLVEWGILFNPLNRKYPYGSISYQAEFGSGYRSQQVALEFSWDF
jgi:outer membrane autotransporter protein